MNRKDFLIIGCESHVHHSHILQAIEISHALIIIGRPITLADPTAKEIDFVLLHKLYYESHRYIPSIVEEILKEREPVFIIEPRILPKEEIYLIDRESISLPRQVIHTNERLRECPAITAKARLLHQTRARSDFILPLKREYFLYVTI
jgi:hypothetical protein